MARIDGSPRPTRSRFMTWVLAAGSLLVVVACSSGEPAVTSAPDSSLPTGEGEDYPTVRFGAQDWESYTISNTIADYIVTNGYGRDTETTAVATAVHQQAMLEDELDVWIELYPQNIREWWESNVAEGNILDLGEIMEVSRRGFYVPRYVVEGDPEQGTEASAPDLVRFEDLADYPDVFPDPEDPSKGQIVSCIIEWACAETARVKLAAYGLDDEYNMLEAGSSAAMDAAIVGPYRQGNPVVFYYWEPTWIVGDLDLVKLEMDPFTPECEEATNALAQDDDSYDLSQARCAYPEPAVHKAVTPQFADRDPEVTEFLDNMFIGIDRMNELTAWQNAHEAEPEDAAMWFLLNFADQWADWVPEDVADRVRTALEADGVADGLPDASS